ncbi:calcium-activated chloride channel regulator 1-like [Hyla sarda]|uniref:calcium-activated chloride channel regulator 1-like n=1 Tax=Hyla sarda TaxID=327740 RepID=UPI0024C27131|nr:calcium-activated chloride channel regulator 1-like [Hyla sarda]
MAESAARKTFEKPDSGFSYMASYMCRDAVHQVWLMLICKNPKPCHVIRLDYTFKAEQYESARIMQAATSLLLLHWMLQTGSCTTRLRDHGYENVIVAVHPKVPENPQILSAIKDMVSEASFYLFNSTKRRFYYREVKILLPSTWKSFRFPRPRYEAHQEASVIISSPNLDYGNDPHTVHYKGCGNKGKYIHFTPEFLTDDSLIPVYGPRGKAFLHEWAHFRWGVFDEYSDEEPFFVSVDNKIKATRCSSETVGMYICKERSCSDGECIIGPQTGNFEEGCMFLVNSTQNVSASIMYMQSLPSIVEFCSEHDHDKEAPNMQNRMCSYRSTWDVIKGSDDYKSTGPMPGTNLPPPPSFLLLQSRARVICLVLDVSDNMATGQRFHQLRQAAAIFIQQLVEPGSYVGIVTFSETAEVRSPLRQMVNDDVRWNLTSSLPKTLGGGLSICEGISAGLQVIKGLDGNTEGSEIILAVSGRDTELHTCLSAVSASGAVIHTIAVGANSDLELESLAKSTGGKMFFASDRNYSDHLIGAFTELFPKNQDTSETLIKITSVQRLIQAEGRLFGSVIMDKTVGNHTVFSITWQAAEPPNVTIQDPSGYTYTNENLDHDFKSQLSYLKVPGTSQVGSWTYIIENFLNISQVLGILVISRPSSYTVPPVTMTGEAIEGTITFPQPVTVFVELKQGHAAVLGAYVTAVIEPESRDPIIVTLNDNGAGADTVKDDGIYSRYVFWFPTNGRYAVNIVASWTNTTLLGHALNNRAMYVPGYIENGTINMNPPKPLFSSEGLSFNEPFSRIHFLGSFTVTDVPENTEEEDVFPPCKIFDLEARLENDHVVLSWTAPGDDYDQGSASSYDIRIGSNPLELQREFSKALSINASSLQPKNGGSVETFTFRLHNVTTGSGIITYIAIRSVDKTLRQSEISNVVHVTRRALQEEDINFSYASSVANVNTTTAIVVCVTVFSLCLIFGAGLYCWRKHFVRDSYRPIQETKTTSGRHDEELPLGARSKDDIPDDTIIILEERADL